VLIFIYGLVVEADPTPPGQVSSSHSLGVFLSFFVAMKEKLKIRSEAEGYTGLIGARKDYVARAC
jgi:hypothetical protein